MSSRAHSQVTKIFPDIFENTLRTLGWYECGPKNSTCTIRISEDALLLPPPSPKPPCLLAVSDYEEASNSSQITFDLTDGQYTIKAELLNIGAIEGDLNLYLDRCWLEITDYEFVLIPAHSRATNSSKACFSLLIKQARSFAKSRPAIQSGCLQSASEQANVRVLLAWLQGYAKAFKKNEEFPRLFELLYSHQARSKEQVKSNVLSKELSNHEICPESRDMPQNLEGMDARSLADVSLQASENERWQDLVSARIIPKYGSTPSNTSKEQQKLLNDSKTWDPQPPGKQIPPGYLPARDFELQTELADHPENFPSNKTDEDRSKNTHLASQAKSQTLEQEDLAAYAQRKRNSRQGTPSGTAIGQSQWPPSPVAKLYQNAESSNKQSEIQSSAGSIERSEYSEDSEDNKISKDRPPPDTDDEAAPQLPPPRVNLGTALTDMNEDSGSHNAQVTRGEMSRDEITSSRKEISPAVDVSTPRESRQGRGSHQPEEWTNDVEGVDVNNKLRSNTSEKLETLETLNPNNESRSHQVASAQHLPSDASNSDIEVHAPRGVNDVPSSIPRNNSQKVVNSPVVQIGRTPISTSKLSDPHKSTRNILDEQPRASVSKTLFGAGPHSSVEEGSHQVRNTSAGNLYELATSKQSEVLETPSLDKTHNLAINKGGVNDNSLKRKRKENEGHRPSSQKAKLYKVVNRSPEFSQNLVEMADTALGVDQIRREFFAARRSVQTHDPLANRESHSGHIDLTSELTSDSSEYSSDDDGGIEKPSTPGRNQSDVLKTPIPHSSPGRQLELETQQSLASTFTNTTPSNSRDQSHLHNAEHSTQFSRRSDLKPSSSADQRASREKSVVALPEDLYSSDSPEENSVSDIGDVTRIEERSSSRDANRCFPAQTRPSGPDPRSDSGAQIGRSSQSLSKPRKSSADANRHAGHNESPFSQSSDARGSLFRKFNAAYNMYAGDEKQFTSLCTRLVNLKPEFSVMKKFYDDFVIRFGTEYKPYCLSCLDDGMPPLDYEVWFEDTVEAVVHRKGVLTKEGIADYLSGQSRQRSENESRSGHSKAVKDISSAAKLTPNSHGVDRSRSVSEMSRTAFDSLKRSRSSRGRSSGLPIQRDHASSRYGPPSHSSSDHPIDLTLDQTEAEDNLVGSRTKKKSRRSLPWVESGLGRDTTTATPSTPVHGRASQQSAATTGSHRALEFRQTLQKQPPATATSTRLSSGGAAAARADNWSPSLLSDPQRRGPRRASGPAAAAAHQNLKPLSGKLRSSGLRKSLGGASSSTATSPKPFTKILMDFHEDPHTPYNTFSRDIGSTRAGAGNAFAAEAGRAAPVPREEDLRGDGDGRINIGSFLIE